MKYSIIRFCSALIATCWLALGSHAADGEAMLHCSLSVVTNNDSIEGLYYLNQGQWKKLNVPPARASEPFAYAGPQDIHFYAQPYSPDEAVPAPLASVRLQESKLAQLIVFIPRSEGAKAYDTVAIANDAASFPPRHLLFYNFTHVTVAGAFNDELVQVEPGKAALMAYGELGARGMRIQLAVEQKSNNAWKRIYASGVPILPKVRWLVLCVPTAKRPWLLMVRDGDHADHP